MNENKKIAFNSAILFVRLCIVSVISLISARLVLQALGASNYGLYNVVGGIVALLNVVNTAMITTTYRYIAYELGKGEKGNPNKVFNSSLAIHVLFGLLILVIGLPLGEWYVSNYLNVPKESLSDAHFVLRVSILTTMISTILVPYQGLLVAFEKFYVSAVIDIITQVLKLVAVFALCYAIGNKLRIYALIMMSYTLVSSTMFLLYSYRFHHLTCRLRINKDWILYREMFSFSGWILFGACSSVGKTQGSAMVINYFFGTIVNAAFAVANQVENFILMFSRMLNQAAVPQITKSFSSGNQERSVKLASYVSKYTYILMSLVAFPLIVEMDFVLGVWLKDVPDGATEFCQLIILGALIGCMGEGIPALTQASGKIKIFQLILSTLSLLGLPISFVCYKFGAVPYTILIVYCGISLLEAVIRLILLKRILNINIRYFIVTSYSRMLYITVPLVVVYVLFDSSSFSVGQHLVALIGLEMFLLLDILVFGVDKTEKQIINNKVKNFKFSRLCKK